MILVKENRLREEFSVPGSGGGRWKIWRSPADLLYREPPPTSLMYAYPDARERPLVLSDSRGRRIQVLFLDDDGRVFAHHRVKLDRFRRILEPEGAARFVLFMRPDGNREGGLLEGTRLEVPESAYHGAEAEYAPITEPPPLEIKVGGIPLLVEVADDREKRLLGLMYRHRVPEGTGMLFLYPEEDVLSFWMLNVRVPLDLAYLDSRGVIRKQVRLEPMELEGKSSDFPVRMVLETTAGWFQKHGIQVGDRVEVPGRIPAGNENHESRKP